MSWLIVALLVTLYRLVELVGGAAEDAFVPLTALGEDVDSAELSLVDLDGVSAADVELAGEAVAAGDATEERGRSGQLAAASASRGAARRTASSASEVLRESILSL